MSYFDDLSRALAQFDVVVVVVGRTGGGARDERMHKL